MAHALTAREVRAFRGPLADVTEFAVDEQRVGHRAVLTVAGEVDVSTAAQLRAAIERAAAASSDVWLDFTGTTFMDSTGIHTVISARSRLAEGQRRLVVICPEGPVLRVLKLTHVEQSLEIHPTRSAAHFAT